MRNIDPALMKNIFNLSQAERKSNVIHNRQLDDFGAGLEIFERARLYHRPRVNRLRLHRQVPLTAP